MASRGEISGEPSTPTEERLYVAVGKDPDKSKSTILWALHNSGGRKICILHVHEPAQWIPLSAVGAKFLASQLEEHQVREYRENERQTMNKLLHGYRSICEKAGVQANTVCIEMNPIEKGIVELICENGIRKLVMGGAEDKHYSKKMMEPKSRKAIYVRQHAPSSCHIWFICKGNLVHTREGRLDVVGAEVESPISQAGPNSESVLPSMPLRSQSVILGQYDQLKLTHPGKDLCKVTSMIPRLEAVNMSPSSSGGGTPHGKLSPDGVYGCWNEISRSSSANSHWSLSTSSDTVDGSPSISIPGHAAGLDSCDTHPVKEGHHRHLSTPSMLEGSMDNELYEQLAQAIEEAVISKREAFEESMRRRKAEKDVVDAIRKGKTSESLYSEELRRRKESEKAVARGNEEIEKMKLQLEETMEALCEAREQKASLERQIASSEEMVQDLEHKMLSAVELLQKYKKDRDELELELEDALRVAKELRMKQADEASSTSTAHFFSEFSFSEIEAATNHFDRSLKIGEGGYGSIYKSVLRYTEVAIKIPTPDSLQGPSEFQQEVTILSKLRHPNLVSLIGACPEARVLVYEYLPNGSLEDRLSCKDNSPPLSWQTRIRIAAEICSVLVFLHSCKPHSIAHGDLKPSNILLDAKYVSKLGDFGICRVLTRKGPLSESTTDFSVTDHPKGTLAYMDPEFISTGQLTPKSDVYSFGIILLRLLTGKPALGIAKEVQSAAEKGNLKDLLDPTAGDWPFVQAKQLAHLAMRCCEMNRKNRPDLASEVSRVLEMMRASCGASSARLNPDEHRRVPHYFICPIFQEIMRDPHVAADGYTYELEAIRGWLDSGNDTSPMTNLQLPHHHLVPNHALRSAIQEWLQHNPAK